ncbi:MAG: hypothetical protein DRI95_11720 [Bacteroidetes bacterium]|nr:MAG: hypothetical protein DRI95_11720 [Bacteroidota bacterium]
MKNKPVIVPGNIKLFHIKVLESEINVSANTLEKVIYKINVGHSIKHNLKEERIKIGLMVNIIGEINKKDIDIKAHFSIDFHYEIKNLSEFYSVDEKNNPKFSGFLIATLLGISFSTARGIIYERLRKTKLAGVILPVVSPQKMILQQSGGKQPRSQEK